MATHLSFIKCGLDLSANINKIKLKVRKTVGPANTKIPIILKDNNTYLISAAVCLDTDIIRRAFGNIFENVTVYTNNQNVPQHAYKQLEV